MSVSPDPASLPDIRLAGFLQSGLGLGETGRLIAHSLTTAGVRFSTHTWEKKDIATVPFDGISAAAPAGAAAPGAAPGAAPAAADPRPGISLLSLNGEHLSSFMKSSGADLFQDRYVISIWFWELPELSAPSRAGFQLVDEVWAATPFIQDALAKHSGDIPVKRWQHPVRQPAGDAAAARQRFPFDDRFVFLFSFDYQSCVKRKNPDAVCEAFIQAFPEPFPGGPLCLIKSINGPLHPVASTLLRRRWAHRPDIVFMDEFLSAADRDLLTWRADACVSLHRSEGLGLTLLEAMSIGKPAIATNYSGNLAFMSPDNSWLIPWAPVKVGPGSLHYPADQDWAEPDPAAAALAMREVFAGGPAVRAKAAAGQEYVATHHSPEACGRIMAQLLSEAAGKKPRSRAGSAFSGRREAYASLAKSREIDWDSKPSSNWLRLPRTLADLCRKMARTVRADHQTFSLTLAALKQQDQRQRAAMEVLQRRVDRLSEELSQVVRLLPPLPPNPILQSTPQAAPATAPAPAPLSAPTTLADPRS